MFGKNKKVPILQYVFIPPYALNTFERSLWREIYIQYIHSTSVTDWGEATISANRSVEDYRAFNTQLKANCSPATVYDIT